MNNLIRSAILSTFKPAAAAGAEVDPYFKYTTLLLHGDGTNGKQNGSFTDSSTNNFSITPYGNATQGTFSPFSQTGWSNYFDGTGDYLNVGSSSTLSFGTGDFTVECWINSSDISVSERGVFQTSDTAGGLKTTYTTGVVAYFKAGNEIAINVGGTTYTTSGANLTQNIWHHIAVTRASGTVNIWVNGVSCASGSGNTANLTGTYLAIAGYYSTSYLMIGYLSNFRIVKGTAVYTSAFTPPTTPLTAISGTSLLTCQSSRFVDNSSNAFAITINGNTSVQAFSPFAPTAAYSVATVGGSGYFDGSGDYIQTQTSSSFTLASTSDWQIDFWYYPLELPAQFSGPFGTTNSNGIFFSNRSGNLDFTNGNDNAGLISSPFPPLNAWNHIVLVNRGSTNQRSVFINGTRTGTITNNYTFTNDAFNITAYPGVTAKGYISNFRVQNGGRDYDPASSSITVPTAPNTTTGSTVLLINFTNAGIIDSTAKNVLETVGNAQIDTTTKKYGIGSIYFDGTGDYLVVPSSENSTLNGDFTVEFWIYRNSGNNFFFTLGDSVNSTGFDLYIGNSGSNLRLYSNNSLVIDIPLSSISFSATTWTHLAIVRLSGSVRIYVGGIQAGAAWSSSAIFSGKIYVGAEFYNGSITGTHNGYIDDLRITKSVARYTANTSPPTKAFVDL